MHTVGFSKHEPGYEKALFKTRDLCIKQNAGKVCKIKVSPAAKEMLPLILPKVNFKTRLQSYNDPRASTNQSTSLKNGLTI